MELAHELRRCAVCTHEWLKKSGRPDPKRCPNHRCRSKRWNQCDPSGKITKGDAPDRVLVPIEEI